MSSLWVRNGPKCSLRTSTPSASRGAMRHRSIPEWCLGWGQLPGYPILELVGSEEMSPAIVFLNVNCANWLDDI